MPQVNDVVVLAASATNQNVLTGRVFGFLDAPSVVSIAAVTVAGTGAALASVRGKFMVGSRVVQEDFPLKLKATGVDTNTDFLAEGAGVQGDLITLQLTNTDAVNAMTVQFIVNVTPVA